MIKRLAFIGAFLASWATVFLDILQILKDHLGVDTRQMLLHLGAEVGGALNTAHAWFAHAIEAVAGTSSGWLDTGLLVISVAYLIYAVRSRAAVAATLLIVLAASVFLSSLDLRPSSTSCSASGMTVNPNDTYICALSNVGSFEDLLYCTITPGISVNVGDHVYLLPGNKTESGIVMTATVAASNGKEISLAPDCSTHAASKGMRVFRPQ